MSRIAVFGKEVLSSIQAEKERAVPRSQRPGMEHCYSSSELCSFQSKLAVKGYLGAHLVESIYGWTLRYDSGLQNFNIIAGVRDGQLDGSFSNAMDYAKEWQEKDSTRRYVTIEEEQLPPPLSLVG